MNDSLRETRAIARRSLLLLLCCGVAAWLLFVAGVYVDLLTAGASAPYSSLSELTAPEFSRYLMFAAVAVFGFGALVTLRRTSRLRAAAAPTALARPVQLFAGTSLIIASALSAVTCMMLFFDGFLGGSGGSFAPLTQTVNIYLPIVLHTALVVTLILVGFVFTPSPRSGLPANKEVQPALQSVPAPAPASAPAPAPAPSAQRDSALGYAIPVVTAAAALIAGLIAADVTGSATQAWLWTIVIAVIGAGIVAGTRAAQRALVEQPAPSSLVEQPPQAPQPPQDPQPGQPGQSSRGAAVGAKNLNFVLSIVLVGSAALMSLGYGASAVSSLSSSPWLSINMYTDTDFDSETDSADSATGNGDTDGANGTNANEMLSWSSSGSDLKPGSEVTVTLQPGNIELGTEAVNRDGWADVTGSLPTEDTPGEYEVEVHAVAKDDREVKASVQFTRNDAGTFVADGSPDAYAESPAQVSAISARWVFSDLVPAGLLLVIAAAVVGFTLTTRARESQSRPQLQSQEQPREPHGA